MPTNRHFTCRTQRCGVLSSGLREKVHHARNAHHGALPKGPAALLKTYCLSQSAKLCFRARRVHVSQDRLHLTQRHTAILVAVL